MWHLIRVFKVCQSTYLSRSHFIVYKDCCKDWIYAPSIPPKTKSVSSLKYMIWSDRRFRMHIGDLSFIPWVPSSAFCRSRPWQNLTDVAELDWNVTQRERSQLTVADREGTYTHPWQTLGLITVVRRRVSGIQHPTVRHGYLDRPWQNVTRLGRTWTGRKNDRNTTASYVSCCRGRRGHSVNH